MARRYQSLLHCEASIDNYCITFFAKGKAVFSSDLDIAIDLHMEYNNIYCSLSFFRYFTAL